MTTSTGTSDERLQMKRAILQRAVSERIGKGYRVISQTDYGAQLVKPKKFHILLFIILLLPAAFPGVLYLIWHITRSDKAIYLEVDDAGKLNQR
jgi:hypothetical protein